MVYNDFHVHMGTSSSGEKTTIEDLIASMDKYHIERSGLSILNGTVCSVLNDRVMEAVKKYPDRIVGYAYINPREENCVEEVHRCLSSGYFKGVKFHSWKHGYYPDNCKPLDDVCNAIAEYDVPVITHTGTPTLSLPQQWAVVAKKHPDVKFVFAHIGLQEFGYGCVICAKELDNVYVGTESQSEIPVIRKAIDELGADRIIFGTDWPYKYIPAEIIKMEPYGLTDEELEKIFYSNARKLWKI